MKKFVFLVTAMMLVSAVSGQRPTIDTLECPDSMYSQQYVYYKFIYNWSLPILKIPLALVKVKIKTKPTK